MDLKTINRNIKTVTRQTAATNALVQATAVGCIEHLTTVNEATGEPYNDANPAMRLVAAVSPRLRAPLIAWFSAYSRINVGKKPDGTFSCNVSKKEDRTNDLDAARANPWFETEKSKDDSDVPAITIEDVTSNIINLAKRLEKKLADGLVLEADAAAVTAKIAAIKALAA